MPPVIGAILVYAGVNVVVAAVITTLISALYSSYEQQKARRAARDAYNASLTDRLQMVSLANGARSRVYGRVRNCDGVLFKGSWGVNKEWYTLVVAVAGHEVDAIEDVYFGDIKVSIDGSGNVTTAPYGRYQTSSMLAGLADGFSGLSAGTTYTKTLSHIPIVSTLKGYGFNDGDKARSDVTILSISGSKVTFTATASNVNFTYQYTELKSYAAVFKYLGGPGQDLSSALAYRFPGLINSSHKFEGVACLLVDLLYDTTAYTNGVPAVTAVVRGAKVYDPRTGTTAWSENPALCARDFALWEYGGGCASDEIDDASITAAANASDVSQTYTVVAQVPAAPPGVFYYTIAGPYAPGSATVRNYSTGADGAVITHTETENADGSVTLNIPLTASVTSIHIIAGSASAIVPVGMVYVPPSWYTPGSALVQDFTTGTVGATLAYTETVSNAGVRQLNIAIPSGVLEVQITYPYTTAMYRCGYVAKTDVSPETHLGELVEAMAGKWGWSGGQLRMRAGVYSAPVMTLDDSFMSDKEARQVVSGFGLIDTVNVYNPTIADQAQNYVPSPLPPIPPYGSNPFITADGVELAQDITLTAVTFAPQAQHICGVLLRDNQQGLSLVWPCNMKAWPLELFDVVAINSARYGWSGKTFEVLGWKHAPEYGVLLSMKETGAAIYTPDLNFTSVDPLPNSSLSLPWNVQKVTGLTAQSGTAQLLMLSDGTIITRVLLTFDAITDQAVLSGGSIEVQYADIVDGVWHSVAFAGDATQLYLTGMLDGDTYTIRARAKNRLASSDWSTQITHTVLGKNEPPADVSGLNADDTGVSWTPSDEVDVINGGGMELRYQHGSSTEWESATALHTGLLTNSPWTWTTRPAGGITLLAKFVDRFGNESVNAASLALTLNGAYVRNVVGSEDYHAAGFPGTIAQGAVSGGNLDAQVTTLMYRSGARLMYSQDGTSLFYPATQYSGLDYITTWWTPPSAQAGDVVTLDYAITGAVGLVIEYQVDQGVMYGAPGSPMYSSDGSSLFYDRFSGASWQPWPGTVTVQPGYEYRWRLTSQAATSQAVLSGLVAYLGAPDLEEVVPSTAIGVGGTRLPLSRTYRQINAVVPGVISGGSGVSALVVDFNAALGPLVEIVNTAGASVAGNLTATIKGY